MSLAEKTARALASEPILRGDPMEGSRYYSADFMAREWENMWTRVWHIGGLVSQLEEPGDVITHNVGPESILMVRDEKGAVRAYYNVCLHRGNRLIHVEEGHLRQLVCSYHGWAYDLSGTVCNVQDPEDFPKGNPCGKLRLNEIPCETWGGFVWFNMDPKAESLRDYLGVVADQLDVYGMENMVRVLHMTVEVECNWKIIQDNFNESYHLPTLHPELNTMIEDSYQDTEFEIYRSGHNRMLMKGGMPAKSSGTMSITEPLAQLMQGWDLDPDDFADRPRDIRKALQQQKRKLGPARGFHHYEHLSDEQLTDFYHYTLFPNVSLTMSSDGFQLLRPQPHPKDPEKCYFDHWYLSPVVEGVKKVETPAGIDRPVEPAEHEVFKHGEKSVGAVADQDLSIAVGQQLGLRSRGYTDSYLSGQENRVRRFHEVLNDYLEGRR